MKKNKCSKSTIRIFLCTLIILCSQNLFAQNSNKTLTGKIVDKNTNMGIPFASIQLSNKQSKMQKIITVSTDDGSFSISNIPIGSYQITISYIGYQTINKSCFIGNKTNDYYLRKIYLTPTELSLSGAAVTSKKINRTSKALNKQIYSIENQAAYAGSSALQVMRSLPSITVSNEGKIALRGSDRVAILIDGKQSSLTGFGNQKGLENISSDNIESIEVITNPSAKYQAQGMAGIINIILKKEIKKGIHGDFGLHFGIGELTNRQNNIGGLPTIQDKYSFTPKIGPNFNLNYRTKKINLFLQGDGSVLKCVNNNVFSQRVYNEDNSLNTTSQFLENRSQQKYNIKLGFDWFLNNQDKLTIYTLWEDEYHIDRGNVPYNISQTGKRKRLWNWAEDEDTKFLNYALLFEHHFNNPGKTLSASFHYTHGREDELFPFSNQWITNNNLGEQTNDSTHLIVKERVATTQIDYTQPLSFGRLEAGVNYRNRQIPITYKILKDPVISYLDETSNLGNWSKYIENIYSSYFNLDWELKWLEIEAGLRLEYSDIKYKVDNRNKYYNNNKKGNYNDLSFFPNIRITTKINERNRVSFFYNHRIDRPEEFDLRPFPKYDDPEILKTGNPYLRPQYTQQFEVAYKTLWEGGSLMISTYYKHIKDIYTRIYTNSLDPNQTNPNTGEHLLITNSITQNLKKGSNLGFELIAEQDITKWWKINGSFNWYKNKIGDADGTVLYPTTQSFHFEQSKENTWDLKINSQIQFLKNWEWQGSYIYYADRNIPQGTIDDRSSLDMALKTSFHRWELLLSSTDLLNTFGIKKHIVGDDFNMEVKEYPETQTISLHMKYKF